MGVARFPARSHQRQTAAQAPKLALQLRKMAELLRPCVKFSFTRAPPPPEPGRQHGLRPVALSSRALCEKCPKTLRGHPRKPQTRPFNSEAHGLTVSYLPDIPLTRPSTLPHVRRPEGSRMQPKLRCSSRRSPRFLLLGRSCCQRRGRLLDAPADSKKCSQRLQHVPATAAAQPQDLPFENLNAEEPASPTPSIPNPELCYIRLIAGSVPLSKWGLHDPSTKEGSQHAPTGASHKNAAAQAPYSLALQLRKMAELLRPCVKLLFTRAPPPPEPGRQHRLRPVVLSSRAFSEKCPKTLRGHPLKPQTRPFNSAAHGLTMSYLPDIPPNKAFNSPTRSSPRGLPDATEAPVQFSKVTALSSAWEKLLPA